MCVESSRVERDTQAFLLRCRGWRHGRCVHEFCVWSLLSLDYFVFFLVSAFSGVFQFLLLQLFSFDWCILISLSLRISRFGNQPFLPFVFCFSIGRWYAVAVLSRHSTTIFFSSPREPRRKDYYALVLLWFYFLLQGARSQEEDLGPDAHGIGKSRMASIDIMRPPIVTRSGRRIPSRGVSSSWCAVRQKELVDAWSCALRVQFERCIKKPGRRRKGGEAKGGS